MGRPPFKVPKELERAFQDVYDRLEKKGESATPTDTGTVIRAVSGGGGGGSQAPQGVSIDPEILDRENVWTAEQTHTKDISLRDTARLVSDGEFVSGFEGSGFELAKNPESGWTMELDKLSVRGSMVVHELLFQQVRTFNGSILIGRTGTGRAGSMISNKTVR